MSKMIEQQLAGYPWVIVYVNSVTGTVSVVSHCKTKAQAEGTVDQLTKAPELEEYIIVPDRALTGFLAHERSRYADPS